MNARIPPQQTQRGKAGYTSVAGRLFEKHGNDPALMEAMKAVPGVMYVGGADTVRL